MYTGCENKLPTQKLSKVISLQPANAFIYLVIVTSRHVTKIAVIPLDPPYAITPYYMKPALTFIETELWATRVYITRIGILDLFAPVT